MADDMDKPDENPAATRRTTPAVNTATAPIRVAAPPDEPAETPDQRREREQREAFEAERKRMDEVRERNAAFERMASEPNVEALKIFMVRPADAQEPPFHFSNTADVVRVVAENPDYARRMAAAHTGQEVWGDANRTAVYEFKPQAPMVLTEDAWKGMQARHMRAAVSDEKKE